MARKDDTIFYYKEKKRGAGWLRVFLLFFVLIAAGVVVISIAGNVNPQLVQENVSVMGHSTNYEGFTVLQISDLYGTFFGEEQQKIANLLSGKGYQAVVLTGDMMGENGDMTALVALLSVLKTNVPVFYVPGDHDPEAVLYNAKGSEHVLSNTVLQLRDLGVTYLDAPVSVVYGGKNVWFVPEYQYTLDVDSMIVTYTAQKQSVINAGTQSTSEGAAALRMADYYLDLALRVQEAKAQITAGDVQIAITHIPLTEEYIRSMLSWQDKNDAFTLWHTSIVLAGHYTGGGWRIPGAGPVYVPGMGFFPGDAGVSGMNSVGAITQYVSPGLAVSSIYKYIPLRLFNRPVITLLHFTTAVF